jgi:TRAP-type C4-dicarboxylate transport system substrate-binding protein
MQLTTTASGDLDQAWLEFFQKALEAESGGQIHANVYPGSQLGSAQTTIEGVAMGTIEVASNASGLYESLDPRFACLAVPGLASSMAQGQKLLHAPAVRAMLETIGRDKGVRVLTVLDQSPAAIVSRRPIKTLADMNGMKIRVPGSISLIEQLRALGAAPIAMSLGEVLPAFQNGTIDGVFAGKTIFTALKYYDVSKNMTPLPSSFLAMVVIINRDFLDGLGKLQQVVLDAASKADAEGVPWGAADVAKSDTLWTGHGGQMFELSDADRKAYLDRVVPVALKGLTPAGRKDYDVLKAAAAKLG